MMRVARVLAGIAGGVVGSVVGVTIARWSHPRIPKADHSRIVVAAVGDSNTFGVGVLAAYPWLSYPAQLQHRLGARFQVLNFGFSGRTVLADADLPYTAEPMFVASLRSRADIVLIMLGTNDAKRSNWNPRTFESDLVRLVRAYTNLPHSPRVLLLTPPQLQRNPYTMERQVMAEQIAPAIRRTASSCGVELIDVHQRTADASYFTMDGAHLDRRGYALVADVVRDSIHRCRA